MVDASAFYYDANPKGVVGQSTGKSHTISQSSLSSVRCKMCGVLGLCWAGTGLRFHCVEFPFSFTLPNKFVT